MTRELAKTMRDSSEKLLQISKINLVEANTNVLVNEKLLNFNKEKQISIEKELEISNNELNFINNRFKSPYWYPEEDDEILEKAIEKQKRNTIFLSLIKKKGNYIKKQLKLLKTRQYIANNIINSLKTTLLAANINWMINNIDKLDSSIDISLIDFIANKDHVWLSSNLNDNFDIFNNNVNIFINFDETYTL